MNKDTTRPNGDEAAREALRTALCKAAVGNRHAIDSGEIRLWADPTKPGNALSQLTDRILAAALAASAPSGAAGVGGNALTPDRIRWIFKMYEANEIEGVLIEIAERAALSTHPAPAMGGKGCPHLGQCHMDDECSGHCLPAPGEGLSEERVTKFMEMVGQYAKAYWDANTPPAGVRYWDSTRADAELAEARRAIESEVRALLSSSGNHTGLDPEMGFILEAANKGEIAAYDYAVAQHCDATLKILDGEDHGQGTNVEPWATVRKRLLALMASSGERAVPSLLTEAHDMLHRVLTVFIPTNDGAHEEVCRLMERLRAASPVTPQEGRAVLERVCSACKGSGGVTMWMANENDRSGQSDYTQRTQCPDCEGTGRGIGVATPVTSRLEGVDGALWRNHCETLLDVWDDGQKPFEERAYLDGMWRTCIEHLRADLAATPPAQDVSEGDGPKDSARPLGMFEHRCPNVTGHRGGVFVCQRAGHGVSQESYCANCECAPARAAQEGEAKDAGVRVQEIQITDAQRQSTTSTSRGIE